MDLVERELDWVLSSPNFFKQDADVVAAQEAVSGMEFPLPGPLTHANRIDYLEMSESINFLNHDRAIACRDLLRAELPTMTSGRLGLRFEKYLDCLLRTRFGQRNVLNRVAVRSALQNHHVKTWGEFDFLLFNNELKRVEHWESAVKFYMQVKDESAWKWCWGPGVADRLDLKGPKMFLQQIRLSSTDLGWSSIPSEWQKFECVKRVFAKGTIFYRWEPALETFTSRLNSVVEPSGLADEHLKSWWILPSEVKELQNHFPEARVVVLPRLYWMTGAFLDRNSSVLVEDWQTFCRSLPIRLSQASERKECLYIGLYSRDADSVLQSAGFIATPHFVEALHRMNASHPLSRIQI